MKEFLRIVNKMIGQVDDSGTYDSSTLESMKLLYEKLDDAEKKKALLLLSDILKEDYKIYFYLMSTLLTVLEEEEVIYHIEKMLLSEIPPLWERIGIMYQLKTVLFRTSIVKDKQREYNAMRAVYKKVLQEIGQGQNNYPWVPWDKREKRVVIVVSQILEIAHAPTRKLLSICKYYKELGYEISLYVSFFPGKTEVDYIFWYSGYAQRNLLEGTMPFAIELEDRIEGYNLCMKCDDFVLELGKAAEMIYNQRPEFVFELGDVTLLAGLCQTFTTVVTMGCTREVPVTTAPIIANYFKHSMDGKERFRQWTENNQLVIDVMHKNIDEFEVEDIEVIKSDAAKIRKELNIEEGKFVILVAGNRLDSEITDSFLQVLYRILGQSDKFIVTFVGKSNEVQKKTEGSPLRGQMLFLGNRPDFKEVMAMGDLFLNPPRQGGSTGAFYAAISGVPVITLGDCDVEAAVGEASICETVEQMPELVSRYFMDSVFYEERKKVIMSYMEKELKVDSKENFKKLCEVVKEVTLKMEEGKEAGYGQ